MADLRNIVEWDPDATEIEQTVGDGPGLNAEYRVTVGGMGTPVTLTYKVSSFDPQTSLEFGASNRFITSHDTVEIGAAPADGGTIVRYTAQLEAQDGSGLDDEMLQAGLSDLGSGAGAGLARELDGVVEA